jgi:glucose/arabinose dehydrogenase
MTFRILGVAIALCAVAPAASAQLRVRPIASGFASPVAVVADPTDRNVFFVVQQNGHIRAVRGGTVLGADFLDLSAATVMNGEQGLLGLAFAPDYATSQRFFVNFTNRQGDTVVARFRRSTADPVVADPASRFDLRWGGANGASVIRQPYANHNGGNLVFGPDGFLYLGMGDGGSGNDPENRAQNPNELLGKMLRIDVSVPDSDPVGYRIPPTNPFVNGPPIPARQEIWAFGLRNPWRFSFDDPGRSGTGALVIGDVGQNRYEEIDYEPLAHGGRNYGWRIREGAHNNVTTQPAAYLPLTEPIFEYDHSAGQSITGGLVYRGKALGADYQGRYFFADFVQGRVWSLALTIGDNGEATASDLREHTADLGGSALGPVSSFGLDADGELLIVGYGTGRISLIIGPSVAPPTPSGLRIIRP